VQAAHKIVKNRASSSLIEIKAISLAEFIELELEVPTWQGSMFPAEAI